MALKKTTKAKKVDKSTRVVQKSGVIKSAKAQTKKVTGSTRNMAHKVNANTGANNINYIVDSDKRKPKGEKIRPKKMTRGNRHTQVYINKNAK